MAYAQNPVSGLTVDPLSPSIAGSARTDYVLHFTTSATGALAAGHTSPSRSPWARTRSRSSTPSSPITRSMRQSGPAAPAPTRSRFARSARASRSRTATRVTVELDGVTNPPSASNRSAQQTLSVVTDTDAVTAPRELHGRLTRAPISTPTVDNIFAIDSGGRADGLRDHIQHLRGLGGCPGTDAQPDHDHPPGPRPRALTLRRSSTPSSPTPRRAAGSAAAASAPSTVEICTIASGKSDGA